jgi:hypothetical protein
VVRADTCIVLTNKGNSGSGRKGKDAAMEKWDAELRASLAAKKTEKVPINPSKLSKQDREMYESRMKTEAGIRERVEKTYSGALHGLVILQNIVAACPEELGEYFPELVELVLNGVVKYGPMILGDRSKEGFLVSFPSVRELKRMHKLIQYSPLAITVRRGLRNSAFG